MGLIDGVDHCVVTVRDLDAASLAYARLGFALTPRGHHSKLGTHNHTIMFADGRTYFEILGVESPGANAAFYELFLADREGISSVALRASDARAVHAAMKGAPFRAGAAIDFARAVELPGGTREAKFTVTQFDPDATPGARAFVCQHHTRDVVWRADMLAHENGAHALKSVTIVAAEVKAAAARWAALFDVEPVVDAEEAVVLTATAAVILLTPAAFARRFPGEALARLAPPFCAALGFEIADRKATAAFFAQRGIANTGARDAPLVVPSTAACGTVLLFG